MKDKYNILFVCSSNVCRSPYCEFLLRAKIQNDEELKDKIVVKSCAVFNKSKQIFSKAVVALEKEGFNREEILAHVPAFKRGSEDRFEEADIIIGMSKMHKLLTPKKYRNKYKTLSQAVDGEYKAIPDPFLATSQEKYDQTMAVLKVYVEGLYQKLKKM